MACKWAEGEAKGFGPIIEGAGRALINMHHALERKEVKAITKRDGDIICHGGGDFISRAAAVGGGNGDAIEMACMGSIMREGSAHAMRSEAEAKHREEGLNRNKVA